MRMPLIKFLTVAVVVLLAGAVEAKGPGDLRGYTLAPGDRITVTVFGQADLGASEGSEAAVANLERLPPRGACSIK